MDPYTPPSEQSLRTWEIGGCSFAAAMAVFVFAFVAVVFLVFGILFSLLPPTR